MDEIEQEDARIAGIQTKAIGAAVDLIAAVLSLLVVKGLIDPTDVENELLEELAPPHPESPDPDDAAFQWVLRRLAGRFRQIDPLPPDGPPSRSAG